MAVIPGVAPDPVQGQMPSAAAITPTDFGLIRLGGELDSADAMNEQAQRLQIRAQAHVDREAAQPYLLKLEGANDDGWASDKAAYAGAPGFVADQVAKASDRAGRFAPGDEVSPGVRAEYRAAAAAQTNAIGRQAGQYHAQVLAVPIAQAQANADQAQIGAAQAAYTATYAPAEHALLLNHAPGDTGLPDAVAKASDDAAAAAVTTLPPRLQPAFQAEIQRQKQTAVAGAMDFQLKSADQGAIATTEQTANTAIDTIVSTPTAYDNVTANVIPQAIAGLPIGLRAQATHDLMAQAASARIGGLLNHGQPAQAQAELSAGTYDAWLDPKAKEELTARVDAAVKDSGPNALAKALAAQNARQTLGASVHAVLSTGQDLPAADLDAAAAALTPGEVAEYQAQKTQAFKQYAAAGAVRDMPLAQVQAAANAPEPPPTTPDYANALQTYATTKAVAAEELKRRADPGSWAWSAGTKPAMKGPAAAAAAGAQDRGAQNQALWTAANAAQGPARAQAFASYAGTMIGTQLQAGIAPAARQIVPQTVAASLAAAVINAPPEGRLAAMQSAAATLTSLPAAFKLPDGTYAAPQAMLAKQLLAAHLSPVEVSAIADYGNNPAALGRVVAAINDPTLKKAGAGGPDAKRLGGFVQNAMAPFLQATAPLPGAEALSQARIDRTTLVARSLEASQGLSPAAAAQAAAADLNAGYRYQDGYRIPAGVAGAYANIPQSGGGDGGAVIRRGAGMTLAQLTGNGGALLYAPAGAGTPANQRQLYSAQIQAHGRWVTAPDDSGLTLMVPKSDGTWTQVSDRFGRPVSTSWSQLQDAAVPGAPSPFANTPANAIHAPDGTPLPAVSKAAAFSAMSSAVVGQESNGQNGRVSPKGALGLMQLMPDTVSTYAPRLGLPVDMGRAQNDPAYNRQIGNAALQDNLQHYGTGAGIGLALAAYNAGRGPLEGYTDKNGQYHQPWLSTIGDPRTGKISLTDWVNRIPFKETREYVQAVLPSALRHLQAGH